MKKEVCVPLGLRLPTSGEIDDVLDTPDIVEPVIIYTKTNQTAKRQRLDKKGRTKKRTKPL